MYDMMYLYVCVCCTVYVYLYVCNMHTMEWLNKVNICIISHSYHFVVKTVNIHFPVLGCRLGGNRTGDLKGLKGI